MANKTTSNARTKRHLEALGWHCEIVERFNPYAGKFGQRKDLFGFLDIIAIDKDNDRIIGIQACGTDFTPHKRKMLTEATPDIRAIAIDWLKAGAGIQLWGWRKVLAKKGGKQKTWQPRIEEYTIEDYAAVAAQAERQGNNETLSNQTD